MFLRMDVRSRVALRMNLLQRARGHPPVLAHGFDLLDDLGVLQHRLVRHQRGSGDDPLPRMRRATPVVRAASVMPFRVPMDPDSPRAMPHD
jgi:hypothetical protein